MVSKREYLDLAARVDRLEHRFADLKDHSTAGTVPSRSEIGEGDAVLSSLDPGDVAPETGSHFLVGMWGGGAQRVDGLDKASEVADKQRALVVADEQRSLASQDDDFASSG